MSEIAWQVFPKIYRDSVTLMAIASGIEKEAGVIRAGAMMATPANQEIMRAAQMWPENLEATANDLLISVRADSANLADKALKQAAFQINNVESENSLKDKEFSPASIREALNKKSADLVTISTPGLYAPLVAEDALRQGLHVFCFSDNVSVETEIYLKDLANSRGLLHMGPDCGTAIIDGIPLGFANRVRSGSVGIVAASGTGAQEVSCLLDRAGVGVAQIIGVGGRDLNAQVQGRMTFSALQRLAKDPQVKVLMVVSKPPAPQVRVKLEELLRSLGKPAVACLVGETDKDYDDPSTEPGKIFVRGTLAAGAAQAAYLALGKYPTGLYETEEELIGLLTENKFTNCKGEQKASGIFGLYTGGTLAAETTSILAQTQAEAKIIDLGDDQYTVGRPHPMIDPSLRSMEILAAAQRSEVGILLVDCVLGYGSHSDPAGVLAEYAKQAKTIAKNAGRDLRIITSVCGTALDPQGYAEQIKKIQDADLLVLKANASCARLAALLQTQLRLTQ